VKNAAMWMMVALLGTGVSAALAADEPAAPAAPATVAPAAADEGGQVAAEVVKKTHKGLLPDAVAKPTDWFEWGADIRVRQVFINNALDLTDSSDDKLHFMRIRERLWGKFTPAQDVEIGVRLVGEWRCYFEPDIDTRFDEYFLDKLYFKWSNIGGSPVTVKIGRDDMILGRGWLWLEGTPLDGSRTIFFDYAQFTIDLDGDKKTDTTKLDMIYFVNEANHVKHLPVINDRNRFIAEYDAQGAIVMLTHKFAKELGVELYWSYYDLDKTAAAPGYVHDYNANVVGARVFGEFEGGLSYSAELAGELGVDTPNAVNALGFVGEVKYTFQTEQKPEVHFQVEYLSGDNPGSATQEDFVLHFGRYPQWSELFIYSMALDGAIAESANLLRFQLGTGVELTKNTKFVFNYNLLFAMQNTCGCAGMTRFSTDQNLRGHLFQARIDHKFNEWLSGHATVEYFSPGDYYALPRDGAWFCRWELVVTF
jgi:hypothetical protein